MAARGIPALGDAIPERLDVTVHLAVISAAGSWIASFVHTWLCTVSRKYRGSYFMCK